MVGDRAGMSTSIGIFQSCEPVPFVRVLAMDLREKQLVEV
jgi:hypothetical protein